MSDAYASVPKNLRSLWDRLMHVSRRDGLAFGRLQQHIGVLVVSHFMAVLCWRDRRVPIHRDADSRLVGPWAGWGSLSKWSHLAMTPRPKFGR